MTHYEAEIKIRAAIYAAAAEIGWRDAKKIAETVANELYQKVWDNGNSHNNR